MELAVGDAAVLLTTHKTYGEMAEMRCLQALAVYEPLLAYLSSCAERGAVPSAVVVRRLRRVAHRITGAEVDVVYNDAAAHTATAYALRLSTAPPALLLPTATVEGRRCALLMRPATLSQALQPVVAALRGSVTPDGHFEPSTVQEAAVMDRVGVACAAATLATPQTFTMGNEGEAPLRIYTVEVSWSAAVAEVVRSTPEVMLMPLGDVASAGDAGAALAASFVS